MTKPGVLPEDADRRGWPRAPTEAEWAALTEEERARVVARLEEWLSSGALDFMAEGPTHFENKTRSWDRLRRYFSRRGRRIYVAADMGVFYPGETVITPDVIAVLDAGPPKGESWMVAIEGKGPDWALEIHVAGDRRKDIKTNVERYAALGIAEYFVFDWNRRQLFGFRLPGAKARRYQRITPRLGRYPSAVLELDLAVVEGELCFFQDTAQLLGADELIGQLQRMVDEQGQKAQEEMEALQQQLQQAQESLQQVQEALERQQEAHLRDLREALFGALAARGIAVPDGERARILSCREPALLSRWLMRAFSSSDLAHLLEG